MVLFLSLIFCKQEEKLLFFGSISGCTCLILYHFQRLCYEIEITLNDLQKSGLKMLSLTHIWFNCDNNKLNFFFYKKRAKSLLTLKWLVWFCMVRLFKKGTWIRLGGCVCLHLAIYSESLWFDTSFKFIKTLINSYITFRGYVMTLK